MTFAIILINSQFPIHLMGFDCWMDEDNKKTALRLDNPESDSLVNDQILREISNKLNEMLALSTL
jgi:hypothetical protein